MRTLFLAAACFVCTHSSVYAQVDYAERPNANSSVGINLLKLQYYNSCLVFTDAFKAARAWIPQRPSGGPWKTGETLAFDADGWPILGTNQAALSVFFRDVRGHYPAGDYLCLYDGDGEIDFGWDASIKSVQDGRIVVTVDTPTDAGIFVKIVRSNSNDHVRNVRLYLPGFHDGLETFHPLFLSRVAPFKSIRFMDWMRTNDSSVTSWADRTTKTRYTQAVASGVALEYMIELCNELGAEPWFCIPHLADDNYVRQFATMVKERLNPDLRVHVEFSNEVWSPIKDQGLWAREQGVSLKLHSNAYVAQLFYYVQRSVEVFKVFESVFGGTARLQRIISSQFAAPSSAAYVLYHYGTKYEDSADVFGIAPYFGWNLSINPATTVNMTEAEILEECARSIDNGNAVIAQFAADAARVGLGLVSYEAGHGLRAVDAQWEKVTKLTDLYMAASRAPEMKDLYLRYLEGWERNGGGLLSAYGFCALPKTSGSWGALEYIDQPLDAAPKYDSLVTFIERQRLEQFGVAYGTGLPGWFNNTPKITAAGDVPRIGSTDFRIDLRDALAGAPCVIVGSLARAETPQEGLMFYGDFLTPGAFSAWSSMTDGSPGLTFGKATLSLPIPNDPSLVGFTTYWQAFVLDSDSPLPIGISHTSGLEVTVLQ